MIAKLIWKLKNQVIKFQKASQRTLQSILRQVNEVIYPQLKLKPKVIKFTLGRISEQERISIIQTGFKLNQEQKISLKEYYEITEEYSLFQLKG